MKNNRDKVALLDAEVLEELVDELSYLRVMINKEIIPASESLEKVNKNIDKTIENFDAVLASKTTEVIDKIDINFIHKEVIKQVVKKFDKSIRNVNELSEFSRETRELIKVFHRKYAEIEKILDSYEKRIRHTKYFARLVEGTVIVLTFGGGALFYPTLLYILNRLA